MQITWVRKAMIAADRSALDKIAAKAKEKQRPIGDERMQTPNKQVERTATERCGFDLHWRHDTVVPVATALPVAVAHLGR